MSIRCDSAASDILAGISAHQGGISVGIKAGANETILHLQSCHYQALPGVPAQPLVWLTCIGWHMPAFFEQMPASGSRFAGLTCL